MNFLSKIDEKIAELFHNKMDNYAKKRNIVSFIKIVFYLFLILWLAGSIVCLLQEHYLFFIFNTGLLLYTWDILFDMTDSYQEAYNDNRDYSPLSDNENNYISKEIRTITIALFPIIVISSFMGDSKFYDTALSILSICFTIIYVYSITYPLKKRL